MTTPTSGRSARLVVARSAAMALLLALVPGVKGAVLDTAAWTADTMADGSGFGVISGGTNGIAYATEAASSGGTTIAENWNTSLATDGVGGGGVTNEIGGVLATEKGITSVGQDVSFEFDVTNPILLVNHATATGSMDFSGESVTLLDSHNAQLNGNIMTFTGATGSSDDGFAMRFNGTFNTANRMDFLYGTSAATDMVGFTVGLAPAPEPAFALSGAAIAIGCLMRRRRCVKNEIAR